MKFNPDLLNELANKILALHSFKFDSFSLAKDTIFIKSNPPIEYIFDCLSLCVYTHNMDEESYLYLGKLLTEKFETTQNREDCKRREEYAIIFHFMAACPEYRDMKVSKKERPDFILSGEKNIGIEITELTTPRDSILHSIVKQNSEQGKAAAQIRLEATKKHGQKATSYEYYDLSRGIAIASVVSNFYEKKKIFAEIIFKKYRLYEEKLNSFDEFIILCNAQKTIYVTGRNDSDDIVEIICQTHPKMKKFTLCILKVDSYSRLACDKYFFG